MVLGFAILYEINIASLTILIGGVIGNIDPLFMISSPVPVIKEPYRLFSGNRREEPAYLGITVYPHTFRKQWVTKRKIRIILTGILFIDNQVRYQIPDPSTARCLLETTVPAALGDCIHSEHNGSRYRSRSEGNSSCMLQAVPQEKLHQGSIPGTFHLDTSVIDPLDRPFR